MAAYDEAVEVKSDDALRDLQLFSTVTQDIRKVIEQVAVLKAKTPEKWKEMAQELRIEGSFHFLTLKKLNRMAQIRSKNAKDATSDAKQKLDENNLRLQNLQYEVSHLDKEINNCLKFKSKHEEIDLVDIDDFYNKAPPKISQPDSTKDSEHLQMLARLDWELESRKNLDSELTATHDKKEKLSERIKKRKQDLDSLRPSLQTILKSTMPLQEALGDHFTEKKALNNNAYLLPQPLYVLFIQSKAFSEACDHDLETQIGGNVETAKKLKDSKKQKIVDATNLYRNRDDEESDSDNEEEQENQRSRRRSTSASAATESKEKSVGAKKHPLYVSIKIFLEVKGENSPYLLLRFYHYSEPDFVTVVPSLELTRSTSVRSNVVLTPSSILEDLHEMDNGKVININVMGKAKLEDGEKCYLWVQKLAGLDAIENDSGSNHEERFSNMRLMIRLIRHRVNARLTLADQLVKFKNGTIDCDQTIADSYAPSVSFNLASWKSIDYNTYCGMSFTGKALDLGMIGTNDYFFIASLHRGSTANAEVAIAVSNRYPKKWPLLLVNLGWRGDRTSESDLDIREIEVEVNCNVPTSIYPTKKLRNRLLSYQLHRLLSMLDVYVETDAKASGSNMPSEFPTTKLCPRIAKGRSRLKPYNYDPTYKFQCY